MKKSLFKIVCFVLVIALLAPSVFAATSIPEDSLSDAIGDPNQETIDALFTKLNELALEKHLLSTDMERKSSADLKQAAIRMDAINNYESELDAQLEQLGVHKIDPNNAADIAQLEEIMMDSMMADSTRSVSDPPDLSDYANAYSLHQYNSTTTVNGVTYNYTYIYVTDNKGYIGSPLTTQQLNHIFLGQKSSLLRDLLNYNFSFGLSAYLGQFPRGWVADWTLGNAFTVLNSLNQNSYITTGSGNNLYTMTLSSVTQMMYCYVYYPSSGWMLCGVKAPNISFARVDTLSGNIGGVAVAEPGIYGNANASTGTSPVNYATNYVRGNGCMVHAIGYFTISSEYLGSVRFTPGFAQYPIELM